MTGKDVEATVQLMDILAELNRELANLQITPEQLAKVKLEEDPFRLPSDFASYNSSTTSPYFLKPFSPLFRKCFGWKSKQGETVLLWLIPDITNQFTDQYVYWGIFGDSFAADENRKKLDRAKAFLKYPSVGSEHFFRNVLDLSALLFGTRGSEKGGIRPFIIRRVEGGGQRSGENASTAFTELNLGKVPELLDDWEVKKKFASEPTEPTHVQTRIDELRRYCAEEEEADSLKGAVQAVLDTINNTVGRAAPSRPEDPEWERFACYLYWLHKQCDDWDRYVYFPALVYREEAWEVRGGMALMCGSEPSKEMLTTCQTAVSRVVGEWVRAYSDAFRMRHALRSAVSAIMARNMSHNLGSHVLARLGRRNGAGKWYTARYLQQRMDFIAQVATDWSPEWSESAWILQDVLRWFLTQEDLLEYIAASEGFRAHRFLDGGSDAGEEEVEEAKVQPAIRFHIVSIPKDEDAPEAGHSGEWPTLTGRLAQLCEFREIAKCERVLFHTPLDPSERSDPRTDKDIAIAVPGGKIGAHAIYVIIENVIRNAAKHGHGAGQAGMDIVVEVVDDPECEIEMVAAEGKATRRSPARLIRVYDSISRVNGAERRGEASKDRELVDEINKRLSEPLIGAKGELRTGAWGLAEIRIAAGFLQQRTIQDVGWGGEAVTGVSRLERRNIVRAFRSPIGTLGYEFFVLEPRALGVLGPSSC